MAHCRSEPLVAESTRWPALVLQPTRQVSPTTIGESTSCNQPRCWLTTGVSFWLLRAPAGQPWYCSPHGR
ncbi:unnamed protein product [Staurois parvus]|uniref:Uncharacterized protein n=1 Tax=Staurois parvus TaxID=386267 RepID=A0ABN9GJ42_9NEOB|nr:unnamed protein product [Staurois parvus]